MATTLETFRTILRGHSNYLAPVFEVHLVASAEALGEYKKVAALNPNAQLHLVPMRRGIHPIFDIISIYKTFRLLKKIQPDLIQTYTPKAGLVGMVASWASQIPIRVHTFTGLVFPARNGPIKLILILVDRLISRVATNLVPESLGVKDDLQNAGITKKPLELIGHGNIAGVDISQFRPASPDHANATRMNLGICAEDFVFIYVGRLNRDKGILELIGAFRGIEGRAKLLIVGRIDTSAPPDANTLNYIRRSPSVIWLGEKEDVSSYFAIAQILVLPSYREGFPNVVLESAASAVPAIVTNVAGAREFVVPGKTGWIVPVKDFKSLEIAMNQALSIERDGLQIMGKRARSRVISRHDRSLQMKNLINYYESLLKLPLN